MAANAGAIRAGRAFVEAFLDDKNLVRGLRSVQKRLKGFGKEIAGVGKAIAAVGAAGITHFIAATKVFADAGSALTDMKARTGVGVEALSELSYAAGQTGTSTEVLEAGLRGMSKTMLEAANGSKGALGLLKSLGLTFEDLKVMSPEKKFEALGDAISKIKDPTKRAAVAMDVFGKSGMELLPMFQNGAKGLEELRQRARDLGLVMSGKDAEAADTLGDRLDDLWAQFKRIHQVIGAALAPMLTDLANRVIANVTKAIKWINANRDLVVTLLKVTTGTVALGAAIYTTGKALQFISATIGALTTSMGYVSTAIGLIGTILGALLSPVGLVTAAVVALVAWFGKSSGIISGAIEMLSENFGRLKDDVLTVFDAIKSAMAAGDFQAAARVLWTGLNLVFTEGMGAIKAEWDIWTVALFSTFDAIGNAWNAVVDGIAAFFIKSIAFMKHALDSLMFGLRDFYEFVHDRTAMSVEAATLGFVKIKRSYHDPETRRLRRDQVDKQRDDELQSLRESRLGQKPTANDAQLEKKMAERADDLRKAREEFTLALKDANRAAATPTLGSRPLRKAMEDGGVAADLKSKAVTGGTFSSESSRILAGGANPELDELKKIAKNTSKLNKPNWLNYN